MATPQNPKPLTKENLLNEPIFANVDTWPYLPKGIIGQGINSKDNEAIIKKYSDNFARLTGIAEDFINRQRTVLSWLLAVIIGVLGNLAVNLLFGAAFIYSVFSIILLGVTIVAMGALVITIFKVFPTNCSLTVDFVPQYMMLDRKPKVQEDKLNTTAAIQFKIQISDESADYTLHLFNELINNFANTVSLALLRDKLKETKLQIFSVKEIRVFGIGGAYSAYMLNFDLKSRFAFLDPNISEKINSELRRINEALMQARTTVSVYGIDQNEIRWTNRGHIFINAIKEWDFNSVKEEIKQQITDG
jgi:hypothetical protein